MGATCFLLLFSLLHSFPCCVLSQICRHRYGLIQVYTHSSLTGQAWLKRSWGGGGWTGGTLVILSQESVFSHSSSRRQLHVASRVTAFNSRLFCLYCSSSVSLISWGSLQLKVTSCWWSPVLERMCYQANCYSNSVILGSKYNFNVLSFKRLVTSLFSM